MASGYGSWVGGDDWRAYVEITLKTEDATTGTFTVKAWLQSGPSGASSVSSNIQGWAGIWDGVTNGYRWSGAVNVGSFGNNQWITSSSTPFKSQDFVVQKTHAKQTVWGYSEVDGVDGTVYKGYKSKAQATLELAAKTSYTVTYHANNGTGAPSALTKWHDEALTLSSTKPTRTGYTFVGWNTSGTATAKNAAYDGGKSYTTNQALDLYAVWKANAAAPTITSFMAYRSTDGSRDESSTEQITVECAWTMDSGASNRSVVFKYKIGSGSEVTKTVSSPAVSGSTTQPYDVSFSGTSRMTVTAVVTDSTHGLTATRTVTIGPIFKPFHMANKGYAAAFFGIADSAWDRILKIFGRLAIDGRSVSYLEGAKGNAGIRFYKQATGVNQWNPAFIIQTKGGGAWQVGNYDGEELRVTYHSKSTIDANTNGPDVNIGLGNTVRNWHKAISSWNVITTTTGTTAKTFSNLKDAGYSEVMVVGTYTTNASYGGSVVIPIDQLSTTERDWYLGGGHWSAGWGATCKLSLTKMTPYQVRYNGNNGNGTWTLYAR